jgi:hypothetical protein
MADGGGFNGDNPCPAPGFPPMRAIMRYCGFFTLGLAWIVPFRAYAFSTLGFGH